MQWGTPILHGHVILNILGLGLLFMVFLLLILDFPKIRYVSWFIWILTGFLPVCLAAFRRPDNGAEIEPHWFIVSSIGFFILAACFCLFVLKRMKKAGLCY